MSPVRKHGPRLKRKTRPALPPAVLTNAVAVSPVRAEMVPYLRRLTNQLEEALGGRESLIAALNAGGDSDDVHAVLALIADPAYEDWDLASLCEHAGITAARLYALVEQAQLAKGHIEATIEAAKAAPAITRETIRVALPHRSPCTACNGTGKQYSQPSKDDPTQKEYVCSTCGGKGGLDAEGSLEHQRTIYELTGLLKKGGGVTVPIQNNVVVPSAVANGLSGFEQLQQTVGQYLRQRQATEGVPDAD